MKTEAKPDPRPSKGEVELEGTDNFPVRFGMVAVRLGFITPEDLKAALMEQVTDDLAERRHRPIGIILYDRGLMNMTQLHHTIAEMERLLREREGNLP